MAQSARFESWRAAALAFPRLKQGFQRSRPLAHSPTSLHFTSPHPTHLLTHSQKIPRSPQQEPAYSVANSRADVGFRGHPGLNIFTLKDDAFRGFRVIQVPRHRSVVVLPPRLVATTRPLMARGRCGDGTPWHRGRCSMWHLEPPILVAKHIRSTFGRNLFHVFTAVHQGYGDPQRVCHDRAGGRTSGSMTHRDRSE